MNKINLGLIGFGNVGSGVIKLLQKRKGYVKDKFETEIILKAICDRSIHKKKSKAPANVLLTNDYRKIIRDNDIDVVLELIGGMQPAKKIVSEALRNGKSVITANKELIANAGIELFSLAQKNNQYIYFESAVGAGIPIIKTITEGVAGNKFNGLYGIINGTCNFILSQMTKSKCSFKAALEEAQRKGFAEPNPTLDINGMDSTHKLAILINLAMGKNLNVKKIYTEGIMNISHTDIEFAENLDLTIKLLAIAKRVDNEIEARVHPTLISKEHPLASINGINNAIFMDTEPLGDILLSGEGAGQMAAASGVFSDIINISSKNNSQSSTMLGNLTKENPNLKIRKIDHIKTKFYMRFMATDKIGILSQITGILGKHGISINSVTQKAHGRTSTVPVIMLTDYAPENMVRQALEKIHKLSIVKGKPVAIRMEKLA